MANADAPFGLLPIGKVGQNRDAQGLSEYSVASSPTIIYFNDAVEAANTGTITVAAAGDILRQARAVAHGANHAHPARPVIMC